MRGARLRARDGDMPRPTRALRVRPVASWACSRSGGAHHKCWPMQAVTRTKNQDQILYDVADNIKVSSKIEQQI